jgi:hypothetical protein
MNASSVVQRNRPGVEVVVRGCVVVVVATGVVVELELVLVVVSAGVVVVAACVEVEAAEVVVVASVVVVAADVVVVAGCEVVVVAADVVVPRTRHRHARHRFVTSLRVGAKCSAVCVDTLTLASANLLVRSALLTPQCPSSTIRTLRCSRRSSLLCRRRPPDSTILLAIFPSCIGRLLVSIISDPATRARHSTASLPQLPTLTLGSELTVPYA